MIDLQRLNKELDNLRFNAFKASDYTNPDINSFEDLLKVMDEKGAFKSNITQEFQAIGYLSISNRLDRALASAVRCSIPLKMQTAILLANIIAEEINRNNFLYHKDKIDSLINDCKLPISRIEKMIAFFQSLDVYDVITQDNFDFEEYLDESMRSFDDFWSKNSKLLKVNFDLYADAMRYLSGRDLSLEDSFAYIKENSSNEYDSRDIAGIFATEDLRYTIKSYESAINKFFDTLNNEEEIEIDQLAEKSYMEEAEEQAMFRDSIVFELRKDEEFMNNEWQKKHIEK